MKGERSLEGERRTRKEGEGSSEFTGRFEKRGGHRVCHHLGCPLMLLSGWSRVEYWTESSRIDTEHLDRDLDGILKVDRKVVSVGRVRSREDKPYKISPFSIKMPSSQIELSDVESENPKTSM